MQLEDRKQRIDEAGDIPASHRDYWTLRRAVWGFVLVGLIAGPVVILGVTSLTVLIYTLLTGGPPSVL